MLRSIEPLLELYVFETTKLLEEIERNIRNCEQNKAFDCDALNDIYGNIRAIRGAAAMMLYMSISTVAHSLEGLFYNLREQKNEIHNYSKIVEIVFLISDYIKDELDKIADDIEPFGNPECYINEINTILEDLR